MKWFHCHCHSHPSLSLWFRISWLCVSLCLASRPAGDFLAAWDSLLSCSTFILAALQVIFSVSLNLSCICFFLSLQSWSQTSPPNRLSKGGLGVRINQRHPGRKMNIPHFSCAKLSLPLRSGGCLRRLRNSNSCLIPGGAKPPYCPVCSSSQGASEFFLCFKQLTMFSWSDFDSDRAIYVQKNKINKK